MIAKLVTHAPDRLAAIDAQSTALDAFVIDGIRHNIPFLSALMQHPRWREGRLSTGFIAEEFPDGFRPLVAKGETERRLALVAAHVDHTLNVRKRRISGQLREPEQLRFELERIVAMGRSRIEVELDAKKGAGVSFVFADGHRIEVHSDWKPGDLLWRGVGGRAGQEIAVETRPILNGYHLSPRGRRSRRARLYPPRGAGSAALMIEREGGRAARRHCFCPMPGLVEMDSGQGRTGGEDGRATLHRRGDEDGERAERRARRHRQGDFVQGRGFARSRRGDHGVRMTRQSWSRRLPLSPARRSSLTYGYSRAVVAGDEVLISGTTGYDLAHMTMPEDPAEQTRNVYATFAAVVEGAGRTLADIVRLRTFVTDVSYCEPVLEGLGRGVRGHPAGGDDRRGRWPPEAGNEG